MLFGKSNVTVNFVETFVLLLEQRSIIVYMVHAPGLSLITILSDFTGMGTMQEP